MERTGAPEWRVTWRQVGDTVRGTVVQVGDRYRVTLDVELAGDAGRALTRTIALADTVTAFAWAVRFPVRSVTPDPHFTVLHWTPDLAREARGIAPYTRATLLEQNGAFAEAYVAFLAALDSVPEPDAVGLRFLLEHGLGRMYVRDERWIEATTHLVAALGSPSPRMDMLPWTYYRLALAARNLADTMLLCDQARALAPPCVRP